MVSDTFIGEIFYPTQGFLDKPSSRRLAWKTKRDNLTREINMRPDPCLSPFHSPLLLQHHLLSRYISPIERLEKETIYSQSSLFPFSSSIPRCRFSILTNCYLSNEKPCRLWIQNFHRATNNVRQTRHRWWHVSSYGEQPFWKTYQPEGKREFLRIIESSSY